MGWCVLVSNGPGAATLLLLFLSLLAFALAGIWLTVGADVRRARRHLAQLGTLLEELNDVGRLPQGVERVKSIRQSLRDHSDHSLSRLPALRMLVETSDGAASFDADLLRGALDEARSAHERIRPRRNVKRKLCR